MAGSTEAQKDHRAEPPQERTPIGWTPLNELAKTDPPLFSSIMFLEGYDFSSNVYVFHNDESLAIFDPGNDYTAFLQFFDMGFDPSMVDKIVVSHGHFDHAMGVMELFKYRAIQEKKQLEVYIHEEGAEEFKRMVREMEFPLVELKGNEEVTLAGHILRVLYTPGHTVDGVSLYHEETRSLFSGDTILPYGVSAPDKHAGGTLEDLLTTIRMLVSMKVDHVLPGHGWPVIDVGRRVIEATYEEIFKKIMGTEKNVPWKQAAKILAHKGLYPEAVYCADRAVAYDPKDVGSLKLKAMCLNDMGRFEDALDVFSKLTTTRKEEAQDLYVLLAQGYASMGLERYHEALAYFDRVIAQEPRMKEAQVYKGMALYLSGRQDDAMEIAAFEKEFMGRFKEALERRAQAGSKVKGEDRSQYKEGGSSGQSEERERASVTSSSMK